MIETKDIGLDLVVLGSIISVIGVVYNNIILNHIAAMQIWTVSNLLFVIYFYGRWKNWWDGGVSNAVMCGLYLFMLVSGIWGLTQG